MKLYYSPGACSFAPHIALRETEIPFSLVKVDLRAKRTEAGADYRVINAKGYVPALELDSGDILTEAAVILQYIADQKPDTELAPRWGSMERYHLMEWLNFVSSEFHKTLGALFNPKVTAEWRENQISLFGRRADVVAARLRDREYLTGERFTIADTYLYTVLNWHSILRVDFGPWPALKDYLDRVGRRSSVQQAAQAEGLAR